MITFIGERRILPSFDLLLNTTARNYDITIAVTGTPGDTETTLTSDPTLPEPDIMALLVTGRTLEEMRGEEFEVAREQMLSYLAGRVGFAARARSRARHRAQHRPHRAQPDCQRNRSERATDRRPEDSPTSSS